MQKTRHFEKYDIVEWVTIRELNKSFLKIVI